MVIGVKGVAALDSNRLASLVEELSPPRDIVARPAVVDLHAIEASRDDKGHILLVVRRRCAVLAHRWVSTFHADAGDNAQGSMSASRADSPPILTSC